MLTLTTFRRSLTRSVVVALAATSILGCATRGPDDRATADGAAPTDDALVRWVDPFIGTGGHGHTFPGATAPFGMVQLSPDTRLTGWDGCSGYHDTDRHIYGFSHTHLSGTGVSDYGDILLAPIVGGTRYENGADGSGGYRSAFRKSTEAASPGYYRVRLDTWRVDAELTATTRAGVHRYRFPSTDEARIIVDLTHRDTVLDSRIDVVGDREIRGFRRSRAWAQDQHVYFVARFSKPFTHELAVDDRGFAGDTASGTSVKASLRFDATDETPLVVKVGISAVDVEGAAKNLDAEIPDWDFDGVRARTEAAWNAQLAKIDVRGGSATERTNFYTALYHACIAPNTYSDVDGRYRGMDLETHTAKDFTYYTVFSLWDTFRTLHPLLTLIEPERTRDFIQSLLADYRDGGKLPIWALAGTYTGCMIGYHAIPVIADAHAKGIRGFDEGLALDAMIHSATKTAPGIEAYLTHGFIPADVEPESVSKTLEYAYDDWCIAAMARRLGNDEVAAGFERRALSYRNLFDPTTGFFRARVNQTWFTPFDPAEVNFNYTEANAWQYRFFAPHDVEGLAALLGGDDEMIAALDALFTAPTDTTGRKQADITGLIGQYAHGNEPSHHMAYLYTYLGAPEKTQRRVRQILDELYRATPDGLCGNEDCGQMSAWYVMSALALYPVVPGSTEYVIGTPLFPAATIRVGNGKRFTIRANGAPSRDRPYVTAARLNDTAHDRLAVDHADLVRGGALELTVTSEPRGDWRRRATRPVSRVDGSADFIPVPFVVDTPRAFRDRTRITLGCADPKATITYTRPRKESPRPGTYAGEIHDYTEPIEIDATTTVQFQAQRSISETFALLSGAAEATFRKIDHDRRIVLDTTYANQYSAGGDQALIDGIFGGGDYRTGTWQGYHEVDLDAMVDLGAVTEIGTLSIGFLQDQRSWIFMPLAIEFLTSTNGIEFRSAGKLGPDIDPRSAGSIRKRFELKPRPPLRARYVRIRATNRARCPEWHPGAGRRAWIFADEITIE